MKKFKIGDNVKVILGKDKGQTGIIKSLSRKKNKIIIEGYPHNPIRNQQDLDQYMDYIKNYQLNRIKSARK